MCFLFGFLFMVIHLSGLFFAILIQVFGWYCPLTHLEFWLRSKHDPALVYVGSFMVPLCGEGGLSGAFPNHNFRIYDFSLLV